MLMGIVIPMGVPSLLNLPCRQLSVRGGDGENLMAASLHRARLMDVDMARIRAQHALMGTQSRCNHREIGLGFSNEEMNIQVRSAAQGSNQFPGPLAIGVLPVTGRLFHIRFR